ncbi:MAG TPA: FeoB-associated Cys-rich membrane protein [Firmicutes bacterium]|nr:FeoB-associated Cys-rich membrane protein [Bacillota bacterium]
MSGVDWLLIALVACAAGLAFRSVRKSGCNGSGCHSCPHHGQCQWQKDPPNGGKTDT